MLCNVNKSGNDKLTVDEFCAKFGFIPQNSADWRTETIDLSAYTGKMIILRFVSTNDYGNNLYIDNVSVTAASCGGTPLSNKFAILTGKYQSGTVTLKWMMQDDPSIDSIAIFKHIRGKWELVCSRAFTPVGTCKDVFENVHGTLHRMHYRLFYKSEDHPNWRLGGETFVTIEKGYSNMLSEATFSASYDRTTQSLIISGLPGDHIETVIVTDLSGKQVVNVQHITESSEKVKISGIKIPSGLYVVKVQISSGHVLSTLLTTTQ